MMMTMPPWPSLLRVLELMLQLHDLHEKDKYLVSLFMFTLSCRRVDVHGQDVYFSSY